MHYCILGWERTNLQFLYVGFLNNYGNSNTQTVIVACTPVVVDNGKMTFETNNATTFWINELVDKNILLRDFNGWIRIIDWIIWRPKNEQESWLVYISLGKYLLIPLFQTFNAIHHIRIWKRKEYKMYNWFSFDERLKELIKVKSRL